MSKFSKNHQGAICGDCCGALWMPKPLGLYPEDGRNSPGLLVNFHTPYPEREGYKPVTVETSEGPIYLEMSQKNPNSPSGYKDYWHWNRIGFLDETTIEHCDTYDVSGEYRTEDWSKINVGMFILSYRSDGLHDYYKGVLETIKDTTPIIFESELFYNNVHVERDYPSLKLFVFDRKGNK